MKNISLKLQETIYEETETILLSLKQSRNSYINEAIEFYNRLQKRNLLKRQLEKESKLVAEDSMRVLKEFELLEDDL